MRELKIPREEKQRQSSPRWFLPMLTSRMNRQTSLFATLNVWVTFLLFSSELSSLWLISASRHRCQSARPRASTTSDEDRSHHQSNKSELRNPLRWFSCPWSCKDMFRLITKLWKIIRMILLPSKNSQSLLQ